MTSVEQTLEEIGLTESECKVYLALLALGETNAKPIKEHTKLQNSTVHLSLNNLKHKGLLSAIKKGKRNYYRAANPQRLISIIEERKRRLESVLPQLIKQQSEDHEYRVEVYEGDRGLKALHEDMLKRLTAGEEFVVIGAPAEAHERFEGYFLDFHERRLKKRIHLRGLYKKEAAKYAKLRTEMPFTKTKILPEKLSSPMWITTYQDRTMLFVVHPILIGIELVNQTIANDFKEHFELLWTIAEEEQS